MVAETVVGAVGQSPAYGPEGNDEGGPAIPATAIESDHGTSALPALAITGWPTGARKVPTAPTPRSMPKIANWSLTAVAPPMAHSTASTVSTSDLLRVTSPPNRWSLCHRFGRQAVSCGLPHLLQEWLAGALAWARPGASRYGFGCFTIFAEIAMAHHCLRWATGGLPAAPAPSPSGGTGWARRGLWTAVV